jgi:hypothetical protein
MYPYIYSSLFYEKFYTETVNTIEIFGFHKSIHIAYRLKRCKILNEDAINNVDKGFVICVICMYECKSLYR